MWRKILTLTTIWLCTLAFAGSVQASEVLGVHILSPRDLPQASELLTVPDQESDWRYLTIPFSLQDVDRLADWQQFFDQCQSRKFIPIVRLATEVEGEAWKVPSKYDIVRMSRALSQLNWPSDQRIVIVFNEPNHAKEWGGDLDPEGYADVLGFTSAWLKTEPQQYTVLPAGLDLAAPNGGQTMEAFAYWTRALTYNPDLFTNIDAWNSHSYPNPGFSSTPLKRGKMSLRGFEYELAFIKQYRADDLPVYITETGWEENSLTTRRLNDYYAYAMEHIWNNPQIKAVTPFLLNGAPGPFEKFSFFDKDGQKTSQFEAYRRVIEDKAEELL